MNRNTIVPLVTAGALFAGACSADVGGSPGPTGTDALPATTIDVHPRQAQGFELDWNGGQRRIYGLGEICAKGTVSQEADPNAAGASRRLVIEADHGQALAALQRGEQLAIDWRHTLDQNDGWDGTGVLPEGTTYNVAVSGGLEVFAMDVRERNICAVPAYGSRDRRTGEFVLKGIIPSHGQEVLPTGVPAGTPGF